ncbi:MAG: alpha-amylase family glycosyl hydrolase [Bacteroidota bacterium]|nr:alpha-amylase family glycosyl hydrolase [Bacteroidota bacterium]
MNTDIFHPSIKLALNAIQSAYQSGATKSVQVNGQAKQIPYPFPSPADWRDTWIYLLMVDRFDNPVAAPSSIWNQRYGYRQGGTFKGIENQLDYLLALGVGAIWITPVQKNSRPSGWEFNYHGYGIQDFLSIDDRFASDGTAATAEKELTELIESAHARGIFVILDIVLNHSARVFDYSVNGALTADFTDAGIMNSSMGGEPPIEWMNGLGFPRADWTNTLPAPGILSADDAVWPSDLQRNDLYRRRGNRLSDNSPATGRFIRGDFDTMRQLVMEYAATAAAQQPLRAKYGKYPVLSILILAYWYLIAKFDIDGYRIDTVKYVDPDKVEQFGNAMREFALSIGKRNFFTFGEIYDNEQTIEGFIGRNSTDGFGIDAALDFPLFFALPNYAKNLVPVETVRELFLKRKAAEETRLSSHGEAGKYFVSFLDNHDQSQRFNQATTPSQQVALGLAVLFCLQGIPCVYYGTEQGLQGTINAQGQPDLNSPESVREALWGKMPVAFDSGNPYFIEIQALGKLRAKEAALRYGRLYFREFSGNGQDFGLSYGMGAPLAFSRILASREVLVAANPSTTTSFNGFVLADADTNRALPLMKVAYSNLGTAGQSRMQFNGTANFYDRSDLKGTGEAVYLFIMLAPMEVQVLVPV